MEIRGKNVTGITCNSKQVKPGYVFVAIEGEKDDGNNYIDEAIDNGAVLIFTEKDIKNKKVPVVKVSNSRIKLAELLNEFYDYPSEKVYLIGVTGTNGKTTTTHLIYDIFKKAGYKTGLIGTVGINMDGEYVNTSLTTPEPEVLFNIFNKMVKRGIEVIVMEASSHGLKSYRTHGLEFDVAIHTNIERDHINFHGTVEDYVLSKKILFDSLGRNKIAILNIDDEHAAKLVEDNNKVLVITYGLNNKATITASSLDIGNNINFNVCLQRGLTTIYGSVVEPLEFKVTMELLGKHNVYNALGAIAVALSFNIDVETIMQSLSTFRGVSRRLEKVYTEDFTVIDDFSHNPASYEAVFEAIQSLEYNKLILINSIRGNRGIEVNKENAEVISSWYSIIGIDKIIISLSDDVVYEKDRVKEQELSIFKSVFDSKNVDYEVYDTLEECINRGLTIVDSNDLILLLGAQGMDKGKEIFHKLMNK